MGQVKAYIYIFCWPMVIDMYYMYHKSTHSLEYCNRKYAIEDYSMSSNNLLNYDGSQVQSDK